VRCLRFVTLVAFCLGLTGCSLFGKHSRNSQAQAGGAAPADNGTKTASVFPPLPPDRSPPPPGTGGVLAGRVIDSFNRTPPPTYIQITLLGDSGQPAAAPIEVAANALGYFVIPGLQAGKHYQLTARSRDGSHVLAGSSYETPPNPKVLIRISEDLASSTTPPVPPAPAWDPTPKPQQGMPAPPPVWPEEPKTRTPRPVELGPPVKTFDPGAGQQPAPQTTVTPAGSPALPAPRLQDFAEGQTRADPSRGIPARIPPSLPGIGGASGPALTAPAAPSAPAQIPYCQLTGQQLYNFGLYDLNGQPFEFRRSLRGRLVLLDFWGTWCMPCQHAIPHLKGLQQMYGPYGLEVIGIDYEEASSSVLEQTQRARRVCTRLGVNYRILLGTDDPAQPPRCPVRQQFGITSWPTLVLLDENSRVIWRSEGLDARKAQELEMIIRQRLGIR
jgi:thiol-disulfide isomerase/thioredoxin